MHLIKSFLAILFGGFLGLLLVGSIRNAADHFRTLSPVELTQVTVRAEATREAEDYLRIVQEQNVNATTEAIQTKTAALENHKALIEAQEAQRQSTPLATPVVNAAGTPPGMLEQ